MIIVSGRIYVRPGTRQNFLASSLEAVAQARGSLGCRDFVVTADPIEPDRVNVYEERESEAVLLTFRGDQIEHAAAPNKASDKGNEETNVKAV